MVPYAWQYSPRHSALGHLKPINILREHSVGTGFSLLIVKKPSQHERCFRCSCCCRSGCHCRSSVSMRSTTASSRRTENHHQVLRRRVKNINEHLSFSMFQLCLPAPDGLLGLAAPYAGFCTFSNDSSPSSPSRPFLIASCRLQVSPAVEILALVVKHYASGGASAAYVSTNSQ